MYFDLKQSLGVTVERGIDLTTQGRVKNVIDKIDLTQIDKITHKRKTE